MYTQSTRIKPLIDLLQETDKVYHIRLYWVHPEYSDRTSDWPVTRNRQTLSHKVVQNACRHDLKSKSNSSAWLLLSSDINLISFTNVPNRLENALYVHLSSMYWRISKSFSWNVLLNADDYYVFEMIPVLKHIRNEMLISCERNTFFFFPNRFNFDVGQRFVSETFQTKMLQLEALIYQKWFPCEISIWLHG